MLRRIAQRKGIYAKAFGFRDRSGTDIHHPNVLWQTHSFSHPRPSL